MDIENAKTEFINLLPEINSKQQELKNMRKVQNIHKKKIYEYMRNSGIQELEVGEYIFTIKTKPKLNVKALKESMDESTLAPFISNHEACSFSKI